MSLSQSLWIRAVWLEGKREEEGVIPVLWVDKKKKIVFWPKQNAAKAMREMMAPTRNWKQFQLLKCKLIAGKSL